MDDVLLVIAGDNVLDFSLKTFVEYYKARGTTCVMRYWEPSEEKLHKTGVAEVDENGLILHMEESLSCFRKKKHMPCLTKYVERLFLYHPTLLVSVQSSHPSTSARAVPLCRERQASKEEMP